MGWDVEEFCLVESHEMGRRYEVVERFPLGRTTAESSASTP
ncbi:hypothetical protein [Tessaracoccus coleopterorum]|nr:hypothetical protein [Tessaracoccus coleopterorum]